MFDAKTLLTQLLDAPKPIQRVELQAAIGKIPKTSHAPLAVYAREHPLQAVNVAMALLPYVKADPDLQAALLAQFAVS